MISKKIQSSSSIYNEYFENSRIQEDYVYTNIYPKSINGLDFNWVERFKDNPYPFGNQYNKRTFNQGITDNFYKYLYSYSNFVNCNRLDPHFVNKVFHSDEDQTNLLGFCEFIEMLMYPPLINNLKDEIKLEVEPNKTEEKPNEEKKQQEIQENLKASEEEETKVIDNVNAEQVIPENIKASEEESKLINNVYSFDFEAKGFPLDSLTIYEIDQKFFYALDEGNQEQLLKIEREKYEKKIAFEGVAIGHQIYDFQANGFPLDSLTLFGIDIEFFYSLTNELQNEVLEQARNEFQKKEEEKESLKKEKQKNSPLDNKLKILFIRENAALSNLSKDVGINTNEEISEEDWKKLCSCIKELNEEMRNALFKSLPYELIKALPSELKKQAKQIRKKYVDFYRKRTIPKENSNSCSSSLLSICEQDLNDNKDDIFDKTESIHEIIEPKDEGLKCEKKIEYLFEGCEKNEEMEKIFNDLEFYDDLPALDDEMIVTLINHLDCLFDYSDENHKTPFRKYLKSLCLIPKNAYQLIDGFAFMLTYYEEFKNQLQQNDESVKNSKLSQKLLSYYISLCGDQIDLENGDVLRQAVEFLIFLVKKQVGIPILANAYTNGCSALLFDNCNYQTSSIFQEIQKILFEKNPEAKNETILEKIFGYYIAKGNPFDVLNSFNDIVMFKEELSVNTKINYPKTIINMSKEEYLNYYLNKINFSEFSDKFDQIQTLYSSNLESLVSLAFSNISKEIEKYSIDSTIKKNEILEYKINNSIVNDIASIQDVEKRAQSFRSIYYIILKNSNELRCLRKYGKRILYKLKLFIHKFAKKESKIRVNQSLDQQSLKEIRRNEFVAIIKEVLRNINDKLNENEMILNFFREYFDLCIDIHNVVGTDFSIENSEAQACYLMNNHVFKFFIDLYSFLNPLDEEYQLKQKENRSVSINLDTLPKLSKLRTTAPEEEKKEMKLKSDKSGKDFDISLKNTFAIAYGNYSFFVEMFLQHALNNSGRVSKAFFYYIKKAPNEHSINTNIKFNYLTYYFV